ncbi:MAG TPA: protease HtpX [Spirochaetota bacterium]|nr:protease HtpX [Spirochaetota bacterium]HRZ28137.1 protease HtpX [Spirochaetota bacterium]HSA13673.1 protease HtpX [Spirochaetota bacterium]
MLKRIGLFLLTNILVVLTVSLILNVVLPLLGIQVGGGAWGLAVFCGVFGMTGAFISLAMSRWMAKRAYSIRLIDASEQDYRLRELYQMVARLSQKAGLPAVPEVGIYRSNEANAFATGPSKSKSLVAFSTGILAAMTPEEVEAVAAHEVSHIANGDMVTMTLLTGIANALVMFMARIIAQAIDSFLRGDDEGGGLGFIGYIFTVMALETVLMLLASIPLAAFSRFREYRADAGSAGLTSPASMASALKRLGEMKLVDKKDSYAMAKINSKKRISLFSTHPSLEDRIARLQQM